MSPDFHSRPAVEQLPTFLVAMFKTTAVNKHQLEESMELRPPTYKQDVGCFTSLHRMAPARLKAAQVHAWSLHPSTQGVRLWVSSATWSGAGLFRNLRSSSWVLQGKPWS